MSVYISEDRVLLENVDDDKKEILGNIASRINKGGEPPTASMEQEKRMRREIANSNERRRMQSINNGFQSLRSLLPHHEGEKLSKAAILQQTAEYIYSLEQEKTRLLSQNCQLKRLIGQHEGGELPPKKRKTEMILSTDSPDEGLGSMSPEPVKLITVTVNNPNPSESLVELKQQFERERNLRLILEDQVRQLENQLFQQQTQQTQIQFQIEETGEEIAGLQLVTAESLPVGHTQTVVCSPAPVSRCSSPEPQAAAVEQRLPSVLEAAIKAEPKVEVERLPTPGSSPRGQEEATGVTASSNSGRVYVSNTSRQNLETIVEAIRHLEGDHMFGDDSQTVVTAGSPTAVVGSAQDVPLALTMRPTPGGGEMHAYIEYNAAPAVTTTAMVQQQQQSRPGVIVVKQAS